MAKPIGKGPLKMPPSSGHVPGQLIVRFKQQVVEHLASSAPPRTASLRAVAASMPDGVADPLDFLKREGGMRSVRPLFVGTKSVTKPHPGVMKLAAMRGALEVSATGTPRESLRGFQLVELKEKRKTPALMKKLRASSAIELVEPVPNRWLSARADPLINRQWGLRAIQWFNGKHPDAAKVHVAVIDSGVDAGHPDLQSAIEAYRHDGNGARDRFGHGTHVAGIIAALVNNAVGIAGVTNARLHCWKIFDDPPSGSDRQRLNFGVYSAGLAEALDSEIRVINLSIGGTDSSQTEAAIFAELRAAGVVVVAAMGNEFEEGNPKEFPGGYDGVLAVGAIDEADRRAAFSCTGDHIGLVAPGVGILSTVPRQKAILADKTDYDAWPGTSMATPHVAGAAALLYARKQKSEAAAAAIVERLTATARRLPGMGNRTFTPELGHGLLDVSAALE